MPSRNYNGRKMWSHLDVAQLKAAIEAQGFSFVEEIDITIELTLESFAGIGCGPMSSRRIGFASKSVDFENICAVTGRTREQILNKMREIARKELGISGNGHSKNIAEIKEFARRGARTIFDIEDMRRGLKMGSTLIPSDQFKALGVSAQLGVDVTPYLADVSPRIVVDKTQFCRTAER